MARTKNFTVKETITNGVALTEENVGKWVEWTSIITNDRTGRVMRVNRCNGRFDGVRPDSWEEDPTKAADYAYFRDGTLGDTAQRGLFGSPLSHFTNADVGTTMGLSEWLPALAQELHGKGWSPNLDFVTHLDAQNAAKHLGIRWAHHMATEDITLIQDALRHLDTPSVRQ